MTQLVMVSSTTCRLQMVAFTMKPLTPSVYPQFSLSQREACALRLATDDLRNLPIQIHDLNPLTPIVMILFHTTSIQTADEMAYAFPQCGLVHIQ